MQKVFEIVVDIQKKIPTPVFEVNTNDLKSIKLLITITNGLSLLDLTDKTVLLSIRKPDDQVILQDCIVTEATNGKAEIVLENQAYLVPGTHTAEVMCYKDEEVVAVTGTFSYRSIKGIMNNLAVESKSEFTTITNMLKSVQDTIKDVRENGTGIDAQARADIQKNTAALADTVKEVNGVKPTDGKITIPIPDVDTSNLRTKTERLKLEDMSPETLAAIEGGEGTTFNLLSIPQDYSVTPEKTTFIQTDTLILYDFEKATNGYILNGNYVEGGNSYTSEFIAIDLDKDYATNIFYDEIKQVYLYTSDKAFIGAITLTSETFKILSSKYPNCKFIRFIFHVSTYEKGMLVEGKSLPSNYTPYARYSLNITDTKMINAFKPIIKNYIQDNKIGFINENYAKLYDPSKVVIGYINGDGTITRDDIARTSDYIPVEEGKSYVANTNWFAGFYDGNNTLKQYLTNTDGKYYVPIGLGIKYIRLTWNVNDYVNGMFVEGTVLPETHQSWGKYYLSIDDPDIVSMFNELIDSRNKKLLQSKWEGKVVNFLGDSLTAGYGLDNPSDNFTKTVRNLLGLSLINNYGVSGTQISNSVSTENTFVNRHSAMSNSAHLNVIFGGTNDFLHNGEIGQIADTVDITLYGALKKIIEGIWTNNPTCAIALITPFQFNAYDMDVNSINGKGYKLKQYVDAIKNVGEYYAIPVLDLYRNSGITQPTLNTWTLDGLHPNVNGSAKIGTQIAQFLKTI